MGNRSEFHSERNYYLQNLYFSMYWHQLIAPSKKVDNAEQNDDYEQSVTNPDDFSDEDFLDEGADSKNLDYRLNRFYRFRPNYDYPLRLK